MVSEDREKRVQWIYSSKDNRELSERYDVWAKDYDTDLDEGFGWVGPKKAVEYFVKYVPKDGKVLDAGAGTGLCGELLAKEGYSDMTAMDISKGMLEEAKKKNAYKAFDQMVMGEKLDYADNTFDGVISVGVMTVGHAPASSLDELVRVTKPGGYIVYSLRPDVYRDNGFVAKHEELQKAGKWKLAEVSDEFQTLPKGEPEVMHQDWIFQVL
jgi:ubiquinone/menaquinone biosynthesis C-methylase UbiE